MATHPSMLRVVLFVSAMLALSATPGRAWLMTGVAGQPKCPGGGAIVTANVVALNQPLFFNRLGAGLPSGFIFALAGDVVSTSGQSCWFDATNQQAKTLCQPGQVALRSAKRPRPLVLRVNQGQCLQVTFTNLLASPPPPRPPFTPQEQVAVTKTLQASVHVQGMEWLIDSRADGSFVGRNPNSIVPQTPMANKITYTLFARKEGDYLFYSAADVWSSPGGGGDGGQLQAGLFGVVNVEPAGAQWFRSQVTADELRLVTRQTAPDQHPLIDYYRLRPPPAAYDPSLATCDAGAGNPTQSCPVLDILNCPGEATAGCPHGGEIVAGDLTAVISGRGPDGKPARFPKAQQGAPVFNPSYALPDRLQPYREFTIVYHEAFQAVQAFQPLYNQVDLTVLGTGGDNFGINYGMGGIGGEILANRLGVGPEASCTSCKFEEFFLTSWAVGDPAMVVDKPASSCIDGSNRPIPGCKASKAFYPDDPSNVYHSYLSDHTKFRILHAGPDLHHLHHQHAQQWLHSPDSADGEYDDSQVLGPGSAFTLEMVYNGSGNVNQTAGDSIFHCHFYPHFAAGMWSLWRVHDVFEPGTQLDANGTPVHSPLPGGGMVTTTRALPDGEIVSGTPIPALVPLPTLPMAPMPAQVQLSHDGTVVEVCRPLAGGGTECTPNLTPAGAIAGWTNPGFPFFIPGLGGQRAPHPPLHFAHVKPDDPASPPLNGGLPRHLIRGCAFKGGCAAIPPLNYQDFSKTLVQVAAFELPEAGTRIEQVAMAAHAQRLIPSITPEGSATTVNGYDPSGPQRPAQFIFNGLGPRPGAPYADPCVSYSLLGGVPPGLKTRRYLVADVQIDATFNKEGWHFPQERITTLWGDVLDTISGQRPPEPFFFRADSGECIEYTLANLVPNVYELDDFQVRTPTDILGQHIHLVKFDVTASDGATNGFNYEDGTFAPNEVTERIRAINQGGGLAASFAGGGPQPLTATFIPFFGPGPGGEWVGAQATVSRWFADPLLDGTYQKPGVDRTLRTVFTHDHYGPSTHQQAGLYAGLVVEPKGSDWYFNVQAQGGPFGGVQPDGTPLRGPGRPVRGADGQLLDDGGPTTWQAVIQTTNPADSFREFMVEMQDSTLTYWQFTAPPPPSLAQGWCSDNAAACTPATASRPQSGCNAGAVCYGFGFCSDSPGTGCKLATWNAAEDVKGCAHPATATCNLVAGIPNHSSGIDLAYALGGTCSAKNDQGILASCNQSSDCSGQCTDGTCSNTGNACSGNADCQFGSSCNTQPVTCNAPSAPALTPPCPELITLAAATNSFSWNYRNEPLFPRLNSSPRLSPAADTANAYRSMTRGTFGGANLSGDPATPLMRAYAGDDVQVRTLVGAHINPHNLTIHDAKWLMEPAMIDSGWRNSQTMGISEHFEEIFRLPVWTAAMPWGGHQADYLFMAGAAAIEQAAGDWGLIRAYGETQSDLRALPQNQMPAAKANIPVCPALKPPFENRDFTVVALTARQALAGQALVYNSRAGIGPPVSAAAAAPESAVAAKGSIAARASASPNPAAAAELLARTTPITLLESGQPQARTGSRIGLSGRPQPLNLRTRLNFQSSQEAAGTAAQVMSDPSAILYFKIQDLNNGTAGTPCQPPYVQCHSNRSRPEPLVLRANAGDCITVHLINAINPDLVDQPGSLSPTPLPGCDGPPKPQSQCPSRVSLEVGLHPQLVKYYVTRSDGFNAGFNPQQTAAPGSSVTYTWYAGNVDTSVTPPAYIPVEFGAANLLPSDVFNHYQHALFGSLVIEPQGATGWQPADGIESRVRSGYANFHEFVLSTQDGLNATNNGNGNLITLSLNGESVTAVNFSNENLHGGPRSCGTSGDFYCFLSDQATCCTQYDNQANCLASAPCGDPQTPILKACAGEQVRLRLLHGGGINTNEVFELYGHLWAETPYFTVNQNPQSCLPATTHTNLWASTVIGDDHQCSSFGVGADTHSTKYRLANQPYRLQDSLTEWQGSRGGHGPSNHFDVLLESAGGVNGIPGDYLFRTYTADHFRYGLWGLLRVEACPVTTGEVAPAVPGAPGAAAGVGPALDRR